MDLLEYLRSLCLKIVRNEIDHFELVAAAENMKVDINQELQFSYQKNQLKYAVLREILKSSSISEDEKETFKVMLETTSKVLHVKTNELIAGYSCTFVGCLFRGRRHRDYIKHLEEIHPTSSTFQCGYNKECRRNFEDLSDLKKHTRSDHDKKSISEVNVRKANASGSGFQVPVRCNMLSCGGEILPSIQALTSHINTRHRLENRDCVFFHCETRFKPNVNSRNHFRLKHYKPNKTKLKTVHVIDKSPINVPLNVLDDNFPDSNEDLYELEERDNDEEEDSVDEDENLDIICDENSETDDHYLMAYADFINRLITYKFIPVTSVKDIATEFLSQSRRSNKYKEKVLKDSLKKIPNLTEDQINQIVRENINDPFTRAQEELSSEFKRTKFMEEKFKLVQPKEIILNKEEVKKGAPKDCIHYVPIIDTLKVLLEDPSFEKSLNMEADNSEGREEGFLKDVKDGKVYENSRFFRDNPDAVAIMLYSDGVELTNPLSSGKGKHKIVQMFWTLCEIPKYQRSGIDKIQLALVFKEKLLKKYSHRDLFGELLTDLKTLETTGVEVFLPIHRHLKAGLLLYSGDNLESHTVGGFSVCFSSKDVCR